MKHRMETWDIGIEQLVFVDPFRSQHLLCTGCWPADLLA